jgi:hypothetical protein
MRSVVIALASTLLSIASTTSVVAQSMPRYTRIHALKPKEGVFAYARISPDGSRLVYASQMSARVGAPRMWTETLVDLTTKQVILNEPGIDAYWSVDGTRLIYSGNGGVTVRHVAKGSNVVSEAAASLGDYYSWANRDGKDLILTIESNYYYLDHDKPLLPPTKVKACDKIGTGERPLISKDGKRITTFVKGNVVVRGLDNCDDIFDTGIQGAKADFSWDGRYIAFHAIKPSGDGYEIKIVDVQQHTVRTLPGLTGSALFPSWTRDGRLCFRYDGPDYRGFMMASGVLGVRTAALPNASTSLPAQRRWGEIFPDTPLPAQSLSVVLIWAPWSAHSREAFAELEQTRAYFAARAPDFRFVAAADPGSAESDIARQLADFNVVVPRVPISGAGLLLTEARNQMPTTLLFRDGVLVDRRLGAQSFERLKEWIEGTVGLK